MGGLRLPRETRSTSEIQPMNRAKLSLLIGLMLFLTAPARAQAAGSRPNVIILLTDDNGYGDLSCLGNPVLKTPNFDLLHDQSVRLPTFTSPRCVRQREASS